MERLNLQQDKSHLKCQVIIKGDTCPRLAVSSFKCIVDIDGVDMIEDIRVCDRHKVTFELQLEDQDCTR